MYAFEAKAAANHPEPFPVIPTSPAQVFQQLDRIKGQTDYVLAACDLTIHTSIAPRVEIPYAGVFVIEGDDIQHPTTLSTTIQQLDVPLCLTHYGKDLCLSKGIEGVEYLPVGIDPSYHPDAEVRSSARKKMGFSDSDIIVLTVADNHERKHHPLNIKAFSIFAQTHPNAYYIMISRQRPSSIGWDLRSLAREEGVGDKVIVYDQGVPEDRLIQFYQLADAFLLLSACEGFGAPVLEAMACGLPVVGTNSSGIREQIMDAEAGVLIPEEYSYIHVLGNSLRKYANPVLASEGLELVTGPTKEEIISSGLEYASKQTWEKSVDTLEEILERKESQATESSTETVGGRVKQFVQG